MEKENQKADSVVLNDKLFESIKNENGILESLAEIYPEFRTELTNYKADVLNLFTKHLALVDFIGKKINVSLENKEIASENAVELLNRILKINIKANAKDFSSSKGLDESLVSKISFSAESKILLDY